MGGSLKTSLVGGFVGACNPLFYFTDAGEVFVELGPVGCSQCLLASLGVRRDQVQDALSKLVPFFSVLGVLGAPEQPIEDRTRIDFLGNRRRRRFPGNV